MTEATPPRTVDDLLAAMTLEEKVGMLGGADTWHSTGVERLGVPTLKYSDGSAGIRGAYFSGGRRSAAFPCGTAVAATWDLDLARRVGVALGQEAKLKGIQVVLAPTTNMHRTPLAGRNLECFSEDPHLAARMSVAYVDGIQAEGVAACVKHLVANDQEFERTTISAEVDERTLREIYLAPFESALVEAGAWSVMGSYNRLNGTYACEHEWLLTTVLREEWDWDGFVVSDWDATHSTAAALNAGLDCEMPGPPKWRGTQLLEAVRAGEVSEATVDQSVRRILLAYDRTGVLVPGWERPDETEDDRADHRSLAREAAQSAIVLLRNDGLLPLDPASLHNVAVIGPNAAVARVGGGGSPEVRHHVAPSPLAALIERLGPEVEVVHEPGTDIQKDVPRLTIPVTVDIFAADDIDGDPLGRTDSDACACFWMRDQAPGVPTGQRFTAVATGSFVVETSGAHQFGLFSRGRARLFLDGDEIIDGWTNQESDPTTAWGSPLRTESVELRAGQEVEVRVEFASPSTLAGGFDVRMRAPVPEGQLERAVAAASDADVAVLVVGLSKDYESETFDRESMDLPGGQDELIAAVAEANPRTVVLVIAGSPVSMPWDDLPAATAHCWYLGEEGGPALAAVLCGDVDAAGRLPTTIPRHLEDTPAFSSYPGENGQVHYREGIFVGYRHYDENAIEPRYPFGHGLSYADYQYGPMTVERDGDDVLVTVSVENTSARDGVEVVQVYVSDREAALPRPPQELKGFAKVTVPAGATVEAVVHLGPDAFRYFDPDAGGWIQEPGDFEIRVGRSSRDIRATGRISLP